MNELKQLTLTRSGLRSKLLTEG